MKKTQFVILVIVSLIAVASRLYKIGNPVADWHSWRQSDTAAVARNFGKFGLDPLRPRFDDLSNIPSGKDNPMGWRMVEFPVYQAVAYGLERLAPIPIEIALRVVTIAASVGTLILLYILLIPTAGSLAATIAALTYAALPYSIFYGRIILPEPFMVFWACLSVYLVYRGKNSALAAVAGAIALLVKPTAIFLLFPVPYLFWRRYGLSLRLCIGLFIYSLISLFPLWWWRQWILQYPEGIPVYAWLFNEGNIRFKGAWFYWLFAKRLGELILGYWGLLPFGLGVLATPSKKEGWLFRWWFVGALGYLIVVARGNVQHDYYQILLLPVVSIYLGKGLAFLAQNTVFSKLSSLVLLLTCVAFLLAFSWYTMRTYYWVNRPEIVEAGKTADRVLPSDARVIAPYSGDTTLLYQTNRQGWPLGFDIGKKIAMGATHYITVASLETDFEAQRLAREYTVVVQTDRFIIIDLTRPKP